MYENSIKNNLICVGLCTFLYLLSPKTDISVFAEQEKAKTVKTLSWTVQSWAIQKIQTWGTKTISWTIQKTSMVCDSSCKIETLKSIGIRDEIAESLVYTCKIKAIDPRHCVIAWSSILKAESNLWTHCNGFNCFWMWWGAYKYKTYEEWVEDWVNRYTKYWYKAKSASFFYPSVWNKSPSRYCTSEESSWSAIGCPNGQKHSQSIWNKLDKLF